MRWVTHARRAAVEQWSDRRHRTADLSSRGHCSTNVRGAALAACAYGASRDLVGWTTPRRRKHVIPALLFLFLFVFRFSSEVPGRTTPAGRREVVPRSAFSFSFSGARRATKEQERGIRIRISERARSVAAPVVATGEVRGESEHEQEQEQECSNYVPASLTPDRGRSGLEMRCAVGDARARGGGGTMVGSAPPNGGPLLSRPLFHERQGRGLRRAYGASRDLVVWTTPRRRKHVIPAFLFLFLFVFRFSSEVPGRTTPAGRIAAIQKSESGFLFSFLFVRGGSRAVGADHSSRASLMRDEAPSWMVTLVALILPVAVSQRSWCGPSGRSMPTTGVGPSALPSTAS